MPAKKFSTRAGFVATQQPNYYIGYSNNGVRFGTGAAARATLIPGITFNDGFGGLHMVRVHPLASGGDVITIVSDVTATYASYPCLVTYNGSATADGASTIAVQAGTPALPDYTYTAPDPMVNSDVVNVAADVFTTLRARRENVVNARY